MFKAPPSLKTKNGMLCELLKMLGYKVVEEAPR